MTSLEGGTVVHLPVVSLPLLCCRFACVCCKHFAAGLHAFAAITLLLLLMLLLQTHCFLQDVVLCVKMGEGLVGEACLKGDARCCQQVSGKDIMPACATMLGIQHARSCLIQPIRYTVCCRLLTMHTMLCLSAAHAKRGGHHAWLCHHAGHPACQELPHSAHQVYCLLPLACCAYYAVPVCYSC